jgi:hypothetical protein
MNAAIRVRPPECTFAEVRTMTAVIGMPPMSPHTTLPTPCARSSRSGSEERWNGSSRSVASMQSSVSMLATIASTIASFHTFPTEIAERSGKLNVPASPSSRNMGICTSSSCSLASAGANARNASLSPMPATTTSSGPGSQFGLRLGERWPCATRIASPTIAMMHAPQCRCSTAATSSLIVLRPSSCSKKKSPS